MNSSSIDSVKLLIGEKDGAQNRSIPIAEMSQFILSGLISIWLLLILIHLFQNLHKHVAIRRIVDYPKRESISINFNE